MTRFTHRLAALTIGIATPFLVSSHAWAFGPASESEPMRPLWEGSLLKAETHESKGTVTIGGKRIDYRAVAGTLVVRPRGADESDALKPPPSDPETAAPEAAMSYTAYFRNDPSASPRPVIFLYNGGLTTATVWLHIGAFGPKRLLTEPNSYTPPAPYRMVDNPYSLLDVADLVFVDAPGAGFGRMAGRGKEQAFWGTDADAYAFKQFISLFLTRYGRWNAPKYLFGESFGTMRSAVLINMLQADNIDFNGVFLMSPILSFAFANDFAAQHPGIDQSYSLILPTYAAAAWFHNRLPGGRPADLGAFLTEVEQFAEGEYALALLQGSDLAPARKKAVAEKLAGYTGLSADYILKSNLRVGNGQFSQMLLGDQQTTVGRLDARFTGHTFDPLAKDAEYDPQMTATWSAYNSMFNDYSRKTLGVPPTTEFKLNSGAGQAWNWTHRPERGAGSPIDGGASVMSDLGAALDYNPHLRVLVLSGLYDLGTPYMQARYEMRHLGVDEAAYRRIEFRRYPTGHMIYVDDESMATLHRDVSDFVARTKVAGPAKP